MSDPLIETLDWDKCDGLVPLIVQHAHDGRVLMLGYTNREVLGKSMHELTHHHYADGTPFPDAECPILSSVTDAVQQRVGCDTFCTRSGDRPPGAHRQRRSRPGRGGGAGSVARAGHSRAGQARPTMVPGHASARRSRSS